jgi:hypothetical protein
MIEDPTALGGELHEKARQLESTDTCDHEWLDHTTVDFTSNR